MRLIWSPTRDLLQLHARLGRALGDPTVRRWTRAPRREATMPPLDVSETPEGFLIRVDLPGMSRDDIEVTLTEGQLQIAGESPAPSGGEPRRLERLHGPFRRVVPLPRHTDGEAITAVLERGVLTLNVPKRRV
jgi:HSP20 family protein